MRLTDEDHAFAAAYDASLYDHPSVTADTALFRVVPSDGRDNRQFGTHQLEILLVRRKRPPYQNGWALPGGFCDLHETLAQAAARELMEETGLKGYYYGQVVTLDAVHRDPRTRTIGTVYLAISAHGMASEPRANDDAAEAAWFQVAMDTVALGKNQYQASVRLFREDLTLTGEIRFQRDDQGVWQREAIEHGNGLAFDHLEAIGASVEALRQQLYLTDLPYRWLPPTFSLSACQGVFEAVIGQPLLRTTLFEHIKTRLQRITEGTTPATLQQRYCHRDQYTPPEGSILMDLWRS